MLRHSGDGDVKDDAELIVGFLEGVLAHVVPKECLKHSNVKRSAFPPCPAELLEQSLLLLVHESGEVEQPVVEELLASMRRQYRGDYATCAAPRYDLWQAVRLNQGLHHANMVHAHDGSSTQQQRAPADRVTNFPEKL